MTQGLHNLKNPLRTAKKRRGRGTGSGLGTTAGRGTKGQNARSGGGVRPRFEGGHTPLYRLTPKLRGFTTRFSKPATVSVGQLDTAFKAGDKVTRSSLIAAKLVRRSDADMKILGGGAISKKLTVIIGSIANSARAKIEKAGGTVVTPAAKKAQVKTKATPKPKK